MPQRAPGKADFPPHLTLGGFAVHLSHLTQGHTASGVDAWHLSPMSPLADLQRASAVVSLSSSFHRQITTLLRRPVAVRVPGAICVCICTYSEEVLIGYVWYRGQPVTSWQSTQQETDLELPWASLVLRFPARSADSARSGNCTIVPTHHV